MEIRDRVDMTFCRISWLVNVMRLITFITNAREMRSFGDYVWYRVNKCAKSILSRYGERNNKQGTTAIPFVKQHAVFAMPFATLVVRLILLCEKPDNAKGNREQICRKSACFWSAWLQESSSLPRWFPTSFYRGNVQLRASHRCVRPGSEFNSLTWKNTAFTTPTKNSNAKSVNWSLSKYPLWQVIRLSWTKVSFCYTRTADDYMQPGTQNYPVDFKTCFRIDRSLCQ